jgi:hypothetical protein
MPYPYDLVAPCFHDPDQIGLFAPRKPDTLRYPDFRAQPKFCICLGAGCVNVDWSSGLPSFEKK